MVNLFTAATEVKIMEVSNMNEVKKEVVNTRGSEHQISEHQCSEQRCSEHQCCEHQGGEPDVMNT